MIGVLLHPLYGDILVLPWKRPPAETVRELNDNLPLFNSLKSALVSGLEKVHDKGTIILQELFQLEDDQSNLTKLSVLKIIL